MLGNFVHFHVVALDGVYTRVRDSEVVFHDGPAPSREEIAEVAVRVEKRVTRWLRRRKLVDERPIEERDNVAPEPSPLEACMQMSLSGGAFLRLDQEGVPLTETENEAHFRGSGKSPWAAEVGGFNVHAGVTIRAGDRDGLERLCRYGARPPFSLERISVLQDARVAYRLRKPRRNGATHLVLTPVHFLARIASLVPPPRFPLLRLSGVLAPRSSWRAAVVPKRAEPRTCAPTAKPSPKNVKANSEAAASLVSEPDRTERGRTSESAAPEQPRTSLGAGARRPVGARIDWASLLRRVYLEDVLPCPCGGRRALVADIHERDVVVAILTHLGLPTEAPPIARARAPSFEAP